MNDKEGIYYCEPVFRPPSEAYSLLIQLTEGCTFKCDFCVFYTCCLFFISYCVAKKVPFLYAQHSDILSCLGVLWPLTLPKERCIVHDDKGVYIVNHSGIGGGE